MSYFYSCKSRRCSLHVDRVGGRAAQAIADAYKGIADADFIAVVRKIVGDQVPATNIRTHANNHLFLMTEGEETTPEAPNIMLVLRTIIAKGFQHSDSWKPTIKDVLDAAALQQKLGGENPYEDFLNALWAAGTPDSTDDQGDAVWQAAEDIGWRPPEDDDAASEPDEDEGEEGKDAA